VNGFHRVYYVTLSINTRAEMGTEYFPFHFFPSFLQAFAIMIIHDDIDKMLLVSKLITARCIISFDLAPIFLYINSFSRVISHQIIPRSWRSKSINVSTFFVFQVSKPSADYGLELLYSK